jgi:hypothetical protein
MTQNHIDEEQLEQAAENTEPISELANSLVDLGVAREARKTGRTIEEQWDRMGDGFAYQATEMDPHQKQLDDYWIEGETVDVEP